jgi:hypothetical protein
MLKAYLHFSSSLVKSWIKLVLIFYNDFFREGSPDLLSATFLKNTPNTNLVKKVCFSRKQLRASQGSLHVKINYKK